MNKCLIIGNSSLRVSPCIVINKIYFFTKETGIAKSSCLKEKQPFAVILQNSCSQKNCLQSATKRDSVTVVFQRICEILNKTFSTEHLRTTASVKSKFPIIR